MVFFFFFFLVMPEIIFFPFSPQLKLYLIHVVLVQDYRLDPSRHASCWVAYRNLDPRFSIATQHTLLVGIRTVHTLTSRFQGIHK